MDLKLVVFIALLLGWCAGLVVGRHVNNVWVGMLVWLIISILTHAYLYLIGLQ